MDWINIHIKQIRSPAAIGSSPSEFGTWVRVLAYCCEQENGGRIEGGALWKDRQWQQTCAVTIHEVRAADRLIRFDADDVLVNGYPAEKEAEVQRARRRANAGALARWGGSSTCSSMSSSTCSSIARADAEGEREREGERKGEGEASPPQGCALLLKALKAGLADHRALEEWSTYCINDLEAESDEEAAYIVSWIIKQAKRDGEVARYPRNVYKRTEAAKCELAFYRKGRK